jgi:hypothetical protein
MERQHAEGRGRRDRGTRGLSACPGRAFPGHAAGADLPAFLHETSIVIRQLRCRKSPASTSYSLCTLPGRRRSTRCEPIFKVRFEADYDRCHRDRSDRNESYLSARPSRSGSLKDHVTPACRRYAIRPSNIMEFPPTGFRG